MATRLVDEDARDLIRKTGLGRTLFVEAGAGSGKTTMLVDRVVNLVLDQGVSLSSIAAITFTEAAAAELGGRIRARLEERARDAADRGDDELADRCAAAIGESDLAAISTLHGFANRILREFAVAAKLPPRVRVLDEVSSQLAHEDRWERFVDRLHDDPAQLDLLTRATVLGVPLEPRYDNQTTMRDVAAEFNQNWDRLAPLLSAPEEPLPAIRFERFDEAADAVRALPAMCLEPSDKFCVHLIENVIPQLDSLEADDPLTRVRLLASFRKETKTTTADADGNKHKGWGRTGTGAAKNWGGAEAKDAAKDHMNRLNEAMSSVLDPLTNDVLARLTRLVAAEVVSAADERRGDGGLEFHDLLVLARNLLRTNPAARLALHERWTHLLLDEFQDTDPIQIELAVLIATPEPEVGDTHWSRLPVDDGRLFFVGDPKQSIYRFRRADIALFLQARDRFVGADGSVQLTSNFRTVEPIVAWVNAMFAREMAVEIEKSQPAYQELTASRPGRKAVDHRPVVLGGPHPDPKANAATLRHAEAEEVAHTVRTILAQPNEWMVTDRDRDGTNRWRLPTLRDITILVPARTSLPFLRAALDTHNIRYRIATGTLVYDTQEVNDALAAVRAVDDPSDELSLVAALRSPLYACSDVDLFTFRQAGGRWDLRRRAPEGLPPGHPVVTAMAHLHGLWQDRWWMTPSELIERLLRERQAALAAFGDRRPTDVWRRLRFLLEQARSFEEAVAGDLRDFTRWAALQGESMARVHEPVLPETDEESLSIQTIHGSKGLEFPIAILSGMTTSFAGRRSGVSVLWDDDQIAPEVKLSSGITTRGHEPRASLEDEMDVYEKLRLAYVATTRARDHLVVSCHHKVPAVPSANARSYGEWFWRAFDDEPARELGRRLPPIEIVAEQPLPTQPGFAIDDRAQWIADRDALLAPWRMPHVWSATRVAQTVLSDAASGGDDARSDGEVGSADDEDDDRTDQPDDGVVRLRRRGRDGTRIGSAVHAVLEMVDFATGVDIDHHVTQQCEVEGIADKTKLVAAMVRSAMKSEAIALAAQNAHYRELFVTAPIGARVIEGYVDLLIETDAGLVVVDYKTDTVSNEDEIDAKLATYELQAASYAVALAATTGREISECRFVFCRPSGPVERSVNDLADAMNRVRSVLAD